LGDQDAKTGVGRQGTLQFRLILFGTVEMKLLLFSIFVAFAFCLCEGKECLSVRGHVRCGPGRSLGREDSGFGSSSMSGHRGSGSSSSGRGSGGSGGTAGRQPHGSGSSWGQQGSTGNQQPVFIKLIDEDTGGPDDWMDETYASNSGAFQLHGCATDGPLGGHIEPMIRIYHKCKGTPKRFTVDIPVEFIGKEYNLTTVYNLQGPLQNEVDDSHYPVPPCGGKKNKFFLF